jgi:hypothetical protein
MSWQTSCLENWRRRNNGGVCVVCFRTVARDCKLLVEAGLLAARIDLKLRVWRRVWLETVQTHRAATCRQATALCLSVCFV